MALFGKLFWLQVVRGDEYRARAEDNYLKEVRIPADRGLILDRNHIVLVDQRPSFDVTLTANYCGKQCAEVIGRLAAILGLVPVGAYAASSAAQAGRRKGVRRARKRKAHANPTR